MINVIENHLESKFIDSYWLNNIILDQEKNKNKESLNNKYEEEIKLDFTELNQKMENNKYITQKEKNYSESCRKYYTHNSYDSKKDFTGNYQKRESFVKTNKYDKKDIYDKQSKPRIYEYMSKNKKCDIFSTDRESDIIIKSFSRNNL